MRLGECPAEFAVVTISVKISGILFRWVYMLAKWLVSGKCYVVHIYPQIEDSLSAATCESDIEMVSFFFLFLTIHLLWMHKKDLFGYQFPCTQHILVKVPDY